MDRRGTDEVHCACWDGLRVSVALHPMLSALTALYDAVGGWERDVHPQWRRELLHAMPEHAAETLHPLTAGSARTPDLLTLPYRRVDRDVGFDAAMAALSALRGEDIVADIGSAFPDGAPALWDPVLRAPRTWLGRYVDVLRAAWTVLGPVWRRAEHLIATEIARAGETLVRRTVPDLLTTVLPGASFADGVLRLPSVQPGRLDVHGRALTLIPLVSGRRVMAHDLDDPERSWIAYGLPGLETLWPGAVGEPADSLLAAALGGSRAEVLQRLSVPLTMSELADATYRSRSAVTGIVDALSGAGLVSRQRRGRHVYVTLTPRGRRLRALLNTP
jgi:DNA-binding transcriptional ArsR family regulator